jgi:hypothetical protein
MKIAGVIMIAVIIAAFGYPLCKKDNNKPVIPVEGNGFVVAELFTSEGCSSCPPADKLVEKIQTENPGKSIYILAFHVDYWDRQGWKDRFSDPSYTERQRRYADWLHLETVYTPQLVINGQSEYIGSDENAITKKMTAALANPATQTLTLHAGVEGGKVHVDYQAANEKNTELVLALVQRSATSEVRAGENAGKQLSHVQIVRQLFYQDVNEQKKITLNLPNDFTAKGWELIGFIQQKKSGRITAAARVEL